MTFQKIQSIKITCESCGTVIITPVDSTYRSQNGRISQLSCPCCSANLSNTAESAYHRAIEYNNACDAASEFQTRGCSFM